jgi:myo-inositol 2-dehydrogenase/D-chiro-inositol 1-dehydrogenase
MKFCAIGCGGHATQAHGPAQARSAALFPAVQLAACCDLSEDRARAYREQFGFQRDYTDIETMLSQEKPDAVSLVVPVDAVAAQAVPILESGVALLMEKPPGLTSGELSRMIAAAQKGGGIHQVLFNRRFMSAVIRCRDVLRENIAPESIGQINYEMVRYNRFDADFSTTAIHAIDAALFLAGSPFARARLSFRPAPGPGSATAGITIEAECESGTQVRFNVQPAAGRNSEGATIHALANTVVLDLGLADHFRGTMQHWQRDALRENFVDPGVDAVECLGIFAGTRHFFGGLLAGETLAPRLEACGQQVRLMEAIRQREKAVDF